jgi:hypothetical protein
MVNPTEWSITWPDVDGVEATLHQPIRAADGMVFRGRLGSHQGLLHFSRAGTITKLAAAQPGRFIQFFGVDRTNSDTLVWVDGIPGDEVLTDRKLWSAPYPPSGGAIVPKPVARVADTGGNEIAVNAGAALLLDGEGDARLVRLSDGRGWQIPKNPHFRYIQTLWVDERYVWLHATTAVMSKTPQWYGNALVRFERAALGEPTIPSGI